MGKGILLALFLLVIVNSSFACDIHGITGIVEENDLYIPVHAKNTSGITEDEFNRVLDKIEDLYAPIVEAHGAKLKVVRKWDDGTVNAYAQQSGKTWIITMFGGLARHETVTSDGFALVACHELGHHLGGLPKKRTFFGSTWASNEGQSDYFGTMKCMRKYMEKDNNYWIARDLEVPAHAQKKCKENFESVDDIAMCERNAMAGMSLASLFKALRNLTTPLRFDTPDTSVARSTNHNHPAPQCRLDTYFAGTICNKDHYTDVSNNDVNAGVCSRKYQDKDGVRPLCWFKPNS